MAEINWKSKYTELKSKYMSAVDTSFRLGVEQGIQQAQQQQMEQQAQEQAAAEQAAAAGQGQPGQPGAEAPQDGEQPASEHPQGSELDQHISQLEGMLGKSELTEEDLKSIKKSVESIKFGIEMKKSDLAIKGITKALNMKAPMSKAASANLNPTAKAALSMQEKIVSDIMGVWDKQESNLSKSIAEIVAGEGLKKD